MRPYRFARLALTLLLLSIACEDGKKSTFQLPPDLGKGLKPADSLMAVLHYLEGREAYESETLRFHYMRKLVGLLAETRNKPDTLPHLLRKLEGWAAKSTYPIAKGLVDLAWGDVFFWARAQYDSALWRTQGAMQLFKAQGRLDYLGRSYQLMGLIHQYKSDHEEALGYYQRAVSIWERIGDEQNLARSYNNIGLIYNNQGRYAEALEIHQKALLIRERIGDEQGLAYSYNNIGIIYHSQGRYAEALEAYQKALLIRERIGDQWGLAASYSNIGLIYEDQDRYAEALETHQKALLIMERIGDQRGLAASCANIGNIYDAQGRYAEALKAYQKAIQVQERIGDQKGLAKSYHNIGNLYSRTSQYPTARAYYQKALRHAQQLDLWEELQFIYEALALTDSALAANGLPRYWPSAYRYARLYHAYADSLSNEDRIRKETQIESQYQYEKKTALLKAEQEKERALAAAQLRQRETQRNLSLLALGIALIGLGIFTVLYRKIRQQRDLIQKQSNEIQQKNLTLEQYNAELKSTNQALEASNRIIQQQADALQEKNEEILDSIRYAERIQRAILPSEDKWQRLLPESFLLYKPRDIVAGDFYWLEETERYIFLGVADATGHGVPGAFVSIVCANALNKAVLEEGLESPAEILWRVREVVVSQLTQAGEKVKDGMDIALIRFEKPDQNRVVFAGANRPLWVMSAEGLSEMAGTRQPIGYVDEPKPFENVELSLGSQAPAMVYAFTDGIVDQMGGPKGRKLLPKGMREWLLSLRDEPVRVQAEKLLALFEAWRGEHRQMDDVTMVGVRVG